MNHSHRSLYNTALGAWVAVPETAPARGKRSRTGKAGRGVGRRIVFATAFIFGLPCAFALDANTVPTGGKVSAGVGLVETSGNTVTVNQTSQKLAIDWSSFSIGSAATVNFVQPGASAIALNRVSGSDPSHIYGNLSANGQVFLLNPNGVLFAKGAEVNVGGLVASTLSLSNADFMAGNFRFSGKAGSVVNQGDISVADKGYVALLGGQVSNEGTIVARLGSVHLAAGSDITLDFAGDGLINLQVNQGAVNALAENRQLIRADGGAVLMTAKAADALIRAVVNNEGVIEARTVDTSTGTIKLLADMDNGVVNVGGTLDASAPNTGKGGFVETSGQAVQIQRSAVVKGKAWLIDPTDITIDSAAASAIVTSLNAGTNVTESTSSAGSDAGNITVASAISWAGTGTLTLSADHDIAINAAITGTNGGLSLSAGNGISATAAVNVGTFDLQSGTWRQVAANLPTFSATDFRISGGSFIRALSGNGTSSTPYQLADIYGVQGIGTSGMLSGNYVLGSNVDASATSGWNGGAGFVPIGDSGNNFTGVFDGLGHTISGLKINRPSTDCVGLFGVSRGTIRNVGLTAASVRGNNSVGALVGYNVYGGTISNSYATGLVTGSGDSVGGLVGDNFGNIINSYATGTVSGSSYVGGLVGYNGGTISNSHYDIEASGLAAVTRYGLYHSQFRDWISGGLDLSIGSYFTADSSGSYRIGSVQNLKDLLGFAETSSYRFILTANLDLGSLAGFFIPVFSAARFDGAGHTLSNLTFSNSQLDAVGFIGTLTSGSTVTDLGLNNVNVTGKSTVGGLVGKNYGTISNSYATGSVNGSGNSVGGLVGYNSGGTISNSYATGTVIGSSDVGGLVGYNFDSTISNSYATGSVTGSGDHVGGLVGTTDGGSTINSYATGTVIGSSDVGGLVGDNSSTISNSFFDTASTGPSSACGNNSGTCGASGLDTDGMKTASNFSAAGWDISSTGGSSSIWRIYDDKTTPLLRSLLTPLTISASGGSMVYNGSTDARAALSYSTTADASLLQGTLSASTASKNVGAYTVTPSGLYSGQQGYDINYVSGTVNITPAPLTITARTDSKTYDGTISASATPTVSGLVGGDTVSGLAETYDNKNAGSSKTLRVSGYTVNDGNGGSNYSVTTVANTTGTIAKAALTITAQADSKTYDGTISASATPTVSGLVGGDTASGLTETYDNKNAGSSKTLRVSGYTVDDGNSGNNYAVTTIANTTGAIAKKDATVSGSATSVIYNGSTQTQSAISSGLVAGDAIVINGLASGKDAGTYASALSVSGADTGNYNLTVTNADLSITKAPLSITANDANRNANGAAYAGGNGVRYSGFKGGETDGVLGGTLRYSGSSQGAINPGTYAITPRGLTSGNYSITFVDGRLTILSVTPGAPYVAAVYTADTAGQASLQGTSSATATARAPTPPPAPAGGSLAFQTGGLSLQVIDGGMRLPAELAREPLPPLAANATRGNEGELARPFSPGGLP